MGNSKKYYQRFRVSLNTNIRSDESSKSPVGQDEPTSRIFHQFAREDVQTCYHGILEFLTLKMIINTYTAKVIFDDFLIQRHY